MKKWLKQNKKSIFIFGFFILIGVPVIIYCLSTLPVFPPGGNNDWAGFWGGYLGAIIGAAVTIFGVIVTLEETRSQTMIALEETRLQFKEDKRIEHAPLLKIEEADTICKDIKDESIYILDAYCDTDKSIWIKIKNIGLGHIVYFETSNFIFQNHNGDICDNLNGFGCEFYTREVIEIGYEFILPFKIKFRLPPIGNIDDGLLDPKRSRIGMLTFDIIYIDVFENKYKQGVKLCLNMNTDRTQKCINDVTFTLSEVQKAELI